MTVILVGLGALLVCAIAVIVRRSSATRLELRPARQQTPIVKPSSDGQVVLRYASGTTVALDQSGEHQRRRTANGSVVAPLPRRRLPGLMPTAGHAVVPQTRPSRSFMRPKSMDFSDEN